jgi:hypothetical protein
MSGYGVGWPFVSASVSKVEIAVVSWAGAYGF